MERSAEYYCVGIRGGAIGMILNTLFGVRFNYYCLEIYTFANSKKTWVLTKLLQRWICKNSSSIIIQSSDRANLLQITTGLHLGEKTYFQANAPRCQFTAVNSHCNSVESIKVIYSGATNKNWAGWQYVELIGEAIGKENLIIDNRVTKTHSPPNEYYQYLSKNTVGIAFYTASHDPNMKIIGFSSGKINSYLHCGIPVIINDLKPYSDILRRFRCGLVISLNTPRSEIISFIASVRASPLDYSRRAKDCLNYIRSLDTFS